MRSNNGSKGFLLAVGLSLGAAMSAPAAAASFVITSAKVDPTLGVGIVGALHFPGLAGTGAEQVRVGRIELKGTDVLGSVVSFQTYCADIFDVLKPGTYSDATQAVLPFSEARLSAATTFLSHAAPLVTDVTTSAAAQLGLWEILNETLGQPYDLRSGALSFSGNQGVAAVATANNWLSMLGSNDWQPVAGLRLAVLDPGAGNQAQVRIVTGSQNAAVNAVPEPASWAMMATGFGLLGGLLRSQRRRKDVLTDAAA